MKAKTIADGILRAVAILAGIALFGYFLYKIQSVIAYIAIAAVISLIGRPIVFFLRKKLKFKNTLAVITTMLLLVGIIAGIIALFVPLIIKQGQNLSLLDIDKLQGNLENLYIQATNYFGISTTEIEQSIKSSKFLGKVDFAFIPNFLNSFLIAIL